MGRLSMSSLRFVPAILIVLGAAGCSTQESVSPNDEGYRALLAGDYAKAQSWFGPKQAQAPHDPFLELDLGLAYQNLGRMDLAEPLYRGTMVDGKGIVPETTTNPGDAGKSLDVIACQNLRIGLKSNTVC